MKQDTFTQGTPEEDAVDGIIAEWRAERPDLDPEAKNITGRIVRLAAVFQQAFRDSFEPLGINDGEYGLLSPLRRAGEPFALTPTELMKHRMITSGGLTPALDRLERKGLIARQPHPTDRRSSLVVLTDEGKAIVDEAMTRHAAAEHRLVTGLSAADRAELATLLRKLVLADESSTIA